MRWDLVQRRYGKILESLKDILQSEIEGLEGFLIEVNQEDSFYVTHRYELNQATYFASIQVRTAGTYFQLHTFNMLSLTNMRRGVLTGYYEEATSSLLFKLQPSVVRHETALRGLVKKAIHEMYDTVKSSA